MKNFPCSFRCLQTNLSPQIKQVLPWGCYTIPMVKVKKKRNKVYRGVDAAVPDKSTVRRYSAEDRNAIGEWWHGKKRVAKPLLIAGGVVAILAWLLFELVRILTT